ncbi:MAG: 3-dehydroquinate synthase, partial [Neisseriaceae bacterium]|nr:3-dehydroquinate synthase [Neisseriaceae bacterium]
MILTVNAPSHSYPIYIGANLVDLLQQYAEKHTAKDCMIVTNETIAPLYLQQVANVFQAACKTVHTVVFPDGEAYKNLATLNLIYDALMQNRMERKSTLVALGGGVVGDMAGFAAATYQRGMPFIQIPTTLLSQVDSSVGGKTAVNHLLGKNMIGAFYQPQAVFAAHNVLATLPDRELSAGLSEVIKYALLGDSAFLAWLEKHITALMEHNAEAWAYAVEQCCAKKAEIVSADEKESGVRALLNLGHTFGHAIETEMGYGNWLHGEAVAAGMVAACRLSEKMGYITANDTQRVQNLLAAARLPIAPPTFAFEKWLSHMQHDKKVQGGKMRFVLLHELGKAVVEECNESELLHSALQEWLPEK